MCPHNIIYLLYRYNIVIFKWVKKIYILITSVPKSSSTHSNSVIIFVMWSEMAAHSSILAWRIPWMEEPGRLQSTGVQRVGDTDV